MRGVPALVGVYWKHGVSNGRILAVMLLKCVKDGIPGLFGFWVQILRDLASTYVLHRPCSLSLYFGISRSSGWSDLVVNEERNLSQFQN